MSDGIWIALIGLAAGFIAGFFTFKSLKATLKNNIDLALIQIKAGQERIEREQTDAKEKAEGTHKIINSRMTELLELTRKSSKAEGVKEGNIEGKAKEKGEQSKRDNSKKR